VANGGDQGPAPDPVKPCRNGHQIFDAYDWLHKPRGGIGDEAIVDGTENSSMKSMNSLRVETCEFQRALGQGWERGVIVNEGVGPIIDMQGQIVKAPIGNWRVVSENVMTVLDTAVVMKVGGK
jgi:hypothetical protein